MASPSALTQQLAHHNESEQLEILSKLHTYMVLIAGLPPKGVEVQREEQAKIRELYLQISGVLDEELFDELIEEDLPESIQYVEQLILVLKGAA